MSATTSNGARSLIVVSKSQEELALAMSFLRGQEFADRAHLLLPRDLYSIERDELPVSAAPYEALEDIIKVVDRHQPDLVFLFSAYLFSFHGLLSRESLDALLRHLRDRGCRIITSDPFIGLAGRLTLADIDSRMLVAGESPLTRSLVSLVLSLRRQNTPFTRLPDFGDVAHLYPRSAPRSEDGITRLCFFNPKAACEATNARDMADGPDEAPGLHRRWLFVLSANDLHVQRLIVGQRNMIEHLLGMLRFSLECQAQPTLIAPSDVVNQLAGALRDSVELLPVCPLVALNRRLLEAEYVFDWNAFSFWQLTRLASGRPAFAFDRGYVSRTAKPFYETACAWHLGGCEPTFLDQSQLFSPYVLAHLAKMQNAAMHPVGEDWRSSPSPAEVVDRLLA
jgi:hypothetical protein